MFNAIMAMSVVAAIVLVLALVVTVGIAGMGSRFTRLSSIMRRAAAHLNGEAEPPQALVKLLEAAGR